MLETVKRWIGISGQVGEGAVAVASGDPGRELLDHSFAPLAGGSDVHLAELAGNVILVVNTASQCGLTPQYEGLEKLYERYREKGLIVLGFPSNDFGAQEPGSHDEIAQFCRLNFGVTFLMFGKTTVKGDGAHPFFVRLAEITGAAPKWNFHKYLISRDATRVLAFGSMTRPDDPELLAAIDAFISN